MKLWRDMGYNVSETTWDMTLPQAELSKAADKMRSDGIKSVQDRLFEQYR